MSVRYVESYKLSSCELPYETVTSDEYSWDHEVTVGRIRPSAVVCVGCEFRAIWWSSSGKHIERSEGFFLRYAWCHMGSQYNDV